MKQIIQTYNIKSTIDKVWDALVNPITINKWGGGPAIMNDKAGAKFSLWDGEIFGRNLKVIPNKLLVQEWSDLELNQPSKVKFDLILKDKFTSLKLTQTNLPDNRFDDLNDGWKKYYLAPLKDFLEKS